MRVQRRHVLIAMPLVGVFILAIIFFRNSETQANFLGLPTVSCFDTTKPVIQNYTLRVSISAEGVPYPLAGNIGHDPGECLRVIHTDDASGLVYVKANDGTTYTLQNFFQAWRKTFTATQLDSHQTGNGHALSVFLNGEPEGDIVNTPLLPNSTIEVVYR